MRFVVFLVIMLLSFGATAQKPDRKARKFHRDRDKLIGLAKKYYARRNWDAAIDCGYRIIQLDSSNTYGYFFLSDCYVGKADFVRALNVLKGYEQRFPNDAYGLFRIGQLWVSLNRSAEALPYYERSIQIQPNNPLVHFARGLVLYRMNRKEESLASVNTGMDLSVFNSPYMIWFKGVLLYEKNDYEGALLLFQSLNRFQEMGESGTMSFYIGMCYYKSGRHQGRARRYLAKAKRKGMTIDTEVLKDLAIL